MILRDGLGFDWSVSWTVPLSDASRRGRSKDRTFAGSRSAVVPIFIARV